MGTLTCFESFVAECEITEIKVTDNIKKDLINFYTKYVVSNKRIEFILSGTQLTNDELLEVIDNSEIIVFS